MVPYKILLVLLRRTKETEGYVHKEGERERGGGEQGKRLRASFQLWSDYLGHFSYDFPLSMALFPRRLAQRNSGAGQDLSQGWREVFCYIVAPRTPLATCGV